MIETSALLGLEPRPVSISCLGLTMIQASATQVIPFQVLTLSASLLFVLNGLIDYRVRLVPMAGTAAGGHPRAAARFDGYEEQVRREYA